MNRTKYCIANWKMNFTKNDVETFINKWNTLKFNNKNIKVIFCPPFIEIYNISKLAINKIYEIGAQNISEYNSGAYTGEISADMISKYDCKWVIIGHSERRHIYNEGNNVIKEKLNSLKLYKINPILCVGETLEERELGLTISILYNQLSVLKSVYNELDSKIIIAYEPVWAIGTGKSASIKLITETLTEIKKIIQEFGFINISILYGGSVSEKNIINLKKIITIDGFLIGGASLDVNKFYNIYNEL